VDVAKLAHMANQIARNFAAQGEDAAIAATADHIEKFWDPRMKAQLRAGGGEQLSPIAVQALERLAG
jgi:formate dehydrogenase subunit delta